MTRRDAEQLLREVYIPIACFALCFTAGWLMSFPIALRAALRRYKETS